MKKLLFTMSLGAIALFAFASPALSAKSCMEVCTSKAKGAKFRCASSFQMHKNRCEKWGKRRLATCKFKKLSTREKFCDYTKTETGKTCEAVAKMARKRCDDDRKECKERAAVFCRNHCKVAGNRKECRKTCVYYRKRQCDDVNKGCHYLVKGALASCHKHKDQRDRACRRGVRGILCSSESKAYTSRCTDHYQNALSVCQAMSDVINAGCKSYCTYNYY